MSAPNAHKYMRMATRQKIQLGWLIFASMSVGYQLSRMVTSRVTPKRQELVFEDIAIAHPDGSAPEALLAATQARVEAKDTLGLHGAIANGPGLGEFTHGASREFDIRSMAAARKA